MPTSDPADSTADGANLIAAERKRQVEAEGYTPQHDNHHWRGELAKAAAVYALSSRWPPDSDGRPKWTLDAYWPRGWAFKPGTPVRMLVKAGALIAAEIDRLLAKESEGAG